MRAIIARRRKRTRGTTKTKRIRPTVDYIEKKKKKTEKKRKEEILKNKEEKKRRRRRTEKNPKN